MYQKILLAADGSKHSLRAAEQAIYLTKINPEAKLVILYVVDGDTTKSDILQYGDPDVIAKKRLEKLSPIENKALDAGINYEIKITHGEPGPSIVAFANENKIDVVLIGSRGLNSFQEFILGSVSHKVAKRANCPVMIVK
jgi:nucleotide-binding universal stress UspA family protein